FVAESLNTEPDTSLFLCHDIALMNSSKTLRFSYRFLQLLLGLLFLTTSIGKLLDNMGFSAILRTYELFPSSLVMPLALTLSISEFFLGSWIVLNRKTRLCANIALGINIFYLLLAVATNLRGLKIPNCGCFGVFLARPMTWMTVIEDIIVVFFSTTYALLERRISYREAV
ncbi:MAG: MauE/DoxX family redox-associated membrane protein, partial [Deltaproteobacteria bacterium]